MPSQTKAILCLIILAGFVGLLAAMVPPHPLCESLPPGYQATLLDPPSRTSTGSLLPTRNLPNNFLVLRVQFSDRQFQQTAEYPDYLPHDYNFFDRWMVHVSDFFLDASHGNYLLQYHLHPDVITLPKTMAYYGEDSPDTTDVKRGEFAQTLIQMVDPVVDFSQYGGIIVFHAGPGQESDLNKSRTENIWSTYLTRKRLQYYLDPENDSYAGIPTDDGVFVSSMGIAPESEFQDYFPGEGEDNAPNYLFSMYGVLAQQVGHMLGLPTLYDNYSGNGASQGVGNWDLMGTGVWNASGYVPAQIGAWGRTHLGWENPITVTEDAADLQIDYFLNHSPLANRVYKVPISATEYFLLENRQQNPDGSVDPITNQPSYSFTLLPHGEQDYYPDNPNTPEDESLIPFFNFMKNRYRDSEWDFMLPGLGGPIPPGHPMPVDGSGILIWHIDENVIANNFVPNFDMNTVNADASHKGVDLEEADGFQNLDSSVIHTYMYGGPYDAFRAGNNDYFGEASHNGLTSLPTAASYYGGIPLEIYDIGASGNQMSFSIRFGWNLSTGYSGPNPFGACLVEFDTEPGKDLIYPLPDGQVFAWTYDSQLSGYKQLPGFPLQLPLDLAADYIWDGQDLYLPLQRDNLTRLCRLDKDGSQYIYTDMTRSWASHPVDGGDKLYLPFNGSDGEGCLVALDKNDPSEAQVVADFDAPIVANMVLFRNQLYITTAQQNNFYQLWKYNTTNGDLKDTPLGIPPDSVLVGVFKAPILPASRSGELIVQFANSVYLFDENLAPVEGFPYVHDLHSTAPLSIADWDGNGSLDLLISSDSGFAVIDYSGVRMSPAQLEMAASDSLAFSAGVYAVDLDGDGKNEIIGNFSHNRLLIWEHDFKVKRGFPSSFRYSSRNLPVLGRDNSGTAYAWVAADNGTIFRAPLPSLQEEALEGKWLHAWANLSRTASIDNTDLVNQFKTSNVFVDGQVYIYPNPYKKLYANETGSGVLSLNAMTSRDAQITVRIYDISGNLVHQEKREGRAYLANSGPLDISPQKLASGVYIAVVSAGLDTRRIKFAIEK